MSLRAVVDDTSDGECEDCPPSSDPRASGVQSIDALFEALANRRTRYVLAYLESESSCVFELEELANYVVEQEAATGLADASEDHHDRVEMTLHHNCLPKLGKMAGVDYDARSKTVRYWSDDVIEACLELFESEG